MNWILSENTLILRHCPRWLLVPWLISCAVWPWGMLALYPSMAWTNFDLWAALFFRSFGVGLVLTLACMIAARIRRRR